MLRRICISAMGLTAVVAAAMAFATTADAAPSGLSNACWSAESVGATVYGTGADVLAGEGDLRAHACGPMRNVKGSMTCTSFNHWTCEKATTSIKVFRYDAGHLHQRCLGGKITVDPPSNISSDPLTDTVFIRVKRGVGAIKPLGLCSSKKL